MVQNFKRILRVTQSFLAVLCISIVLKAVLEQSVYNTSEKEEGLSKPKADFIETRFGSKQHDHALLILHFLRVNV